MTSRILHWLFPAGLAAVLSTTAFAFPANDGINFSTTFLKMCGASSFMGLQAAGYPFGGINGPNGGVWDGTAGSNNDPFLRMYSHGVNAVRITGDDTAACQIAKQDGLLIEVTGELGPSSVDPDLADYNAATKSGTDFNMDQGAAANSALEDDIYNYMYNKLTAFAAAGCRIDLLAPGVEIDKNNICGAPNGSPWFYQALYEVGCAIRKWDRNNLQTGENPTGIIIHWSNPTNPPPNDNSCSQVVAKCAAILNPNNVTDKHRTLNNQTETTIPMDCFGFSFKEYANPLSNTTGSGPMGLQQAFWKENLGQFGKWLLVQETAYVWTNSPENFPGNPTPPAGGYPIKYTSDDFKDGNGAYGATYAGNPSGYRSFLTDECTIVAGSVSKLGAGCMAWAADDVVGWGSEPDEYNFAFWDSNQTSTTTNPLGLVYDNAGRSLISVFDQTFTLNR